MYILDTCVVSHLGPTQSRPNPSIRDWLRINGDKCFLSVVTLTEIAYGISWLRHRAATTRADRIQAWYEEIVAYHGDRIVPIDTEIAVRAGVLMAKTRAAGFEPDAQDAWIGATAEARRMEVLSFNFLDFRRMGLNCRDFAAELSPPMP